MDDRTRPLDFEGPAYEPALDRERLTRQHEKIRDFLLARPGQWFTLRELAEVLHEPEASISAQLRHLRRPRFGAFLTPKRRRDGGAAWEYTIARPSAGSITDAAETRGETDRVSSPSGLASPPEGAR